MNLTLEMMAYYDTDYSNAINSYDAFDNEYVTLML